MALLAWRGPCAAAEAACSHQHNTRPHLACPTRRVCSICPSRRGSPSPQHWQYLQRQQRPCQPPLRCLAPISSPLVDTVTDLGLSTAEPATANTTLLTHLLPCEHRGRAVGFSTALGGVLGAPTSMLAAPQQVQLEDELLLVPGSATAHLPPTLPADSASTGSLKVTAASVVPEWELAPDASNPAYNRSGLNGLAAAGTGGLSTGSFTVTASMPVKYTVNEVKGIFDLDNKALLRGVVPGSCPPALSADPKHTQGLRRLIILDDNVHRIYGAQLEQYLQHHGVEYQLLVLPTCEENKELELVTTIAEAIETFKINRRQEPLIAIGGGVCLDVAGLAANLYRRNTGIIKVPTTLMAVVDASIGIKTAVNFHGKKNKLGTYCPPLGVFYDTQFLQTLDSRNLSNGSAEVLKMACVKDRELFHLLDRHAEGLLESKFQGGIAGEVVRRSIQGMLEELEYNLWEGVLVRLVDYGHTFSPELEMVALGGPNMLLHGEAVTVDMALSTLLSTQRGLLTPQECDQVLGLMRRLQLPLWHESCNVDLLVKGLEDMTRARDGLQRVPLMSGIGAARFVYDITRQELEVAVEKLLCYIAAAGPGTYSGNLGAAGGARVEVEAGSGEAGNQVLPWSHRGASDQSELLVRHRQELAEAAKAEDQDH